MPTRREPERDPDELDEELDLPPPDHDDGDDGAGDAGDEGDDLPSGHDDTGGLDDADAGDLDVGGDDLEHDDSKADDGDEEVDVGSLDEGLVLDEERTTGAEPEGLGEDEGDVAADAPSEDDGGAEGTSEDPGNEVDEGAFPELDDDGGDHADDRLAEELLAEGGDAIPWAAARWAPLEGAGAPLSCCAVAAAAGRVVAAGEGVLVIEDGALAARSFPFGEASVAVTVDGDAWLAATARGQLLLARRRGAEAVSLGSWRAGVGPSMGLRPAEIGPAVELSATPGRFWIRAGAALLCFRSVRPMGDGGAAIDAPPAAVRERGVRAIAASGGVLLALTAGPAGGAAIERFRSDDEGWAAAPLSGEALQVAERDGAVRLSAAGGGRALAIAGQRRLALSRDGGASFAVHDLGSVLAAAFAGDGEGAPLLVLAVTPGATGTTGATVIAIEGGQASKIAEIAGLGAEIAAGGDGAKAEEPAALAWDASREVVWIAGRTGLGALGKPQRH